MPLISTSGSLSSRGFGEFRRAAPAGQTYWISPVFNGFRYVLKGNNLSTLISGIPSLTGMTPTTPSSPNIANSRFGVLWASGTTAWADSRALSTNNGTSWTDITGIFADSYSGSTYPTIGLNGAFAYRPTGNIIAYFSTYYDSKSNRIEAPAFLANASTGSTPAGSISGLNLPGSSPPRQQILYSPALDRFYVFLANSITTVRAASYTPAGLISGIIFSNDLFLFAAGLSASGNILLFNGSSSTRELREYTDVGLGTYTSYGNVTGLASIGSQRYSRMFHLPVNGRYAVVQEGSSSSNVSFNYSSVGTPASFTRVAIIPTVLSGYSFVSVMASTVFEDTDGWIYVTMMARVTNSKNQTEFWSLAYKSTDGGASFTAVQGSPYNGSYAPLVIAKNLQ